MNIAATLQTDITPEGDDYTTVRRVIELISEDYRDQPVLEDIAGRLGQTPTQLQKTFTRWAGLSPKAFLQAGASDVDEAEIQTQITARAAAKAAKNIQLVAVGWLRRKRKKLLAVSAAHRKLKKRQPR